MELEPEPDLDSKVGPLDEEHAAVISLERGLPRKQILRGAFGRFLPGSLISGGGMLGVMSYIDGFQLFEFLAGVFFFGGLLTLGFGIGMEGLRRWLYQDAEVDGRRSVVAGLLSPLALFISVALFQPIFTLFGPGVFFLVGIVMAVVMYFPWLSPTPEPAINQSEELLPSGDP